MAELEPFDVDCLERFWINNFAHKSKLLTVVQFVASTYYTKLTWKNKRKKFISLKINWKSCINTINIEFVYLKNLSLKTNDHLNDQTEFWWKQSGQFLGSV